MAYIIAIDGPSGSGKSTIAKLIASRLGFLYLDSGALYRTITLYMIQNKLLNKPLKVLKKSLRKINIHLEILRIYLNDKDVTLKIRSLLVNQHVSEVSSRKMVREEVNRRLKEFSRLQSVVIDGRDIGTTVFKNANLKLYLTASAYKRALRRTRELKNIKEKVSFKKVLEQIRYRDNYDSTRTLSPLSKAHDAIVVDTTYLSVKKVLDRISLFLPLSFFVI